MKTFHSNYSICVNLGDSDISLHCLDSLRSKTETGPERNQHVLAASRESSETELFQPVSGDLNPVNLNSTDSFSCNFLWNSCSVTSNLTAHHSQAG